MWQWRSDMSVLIYQGAQTHILKANKKAFEWPISFWTQCFISTHARNPTLDNPYPQTHTAAFLFNQKQLHQCCHENHDTSLFLKVPWRLYEPDLKITHCTVWSSDHFDHLSKASLSPCGVCCHWKVGVSVFFINPNCTEREHLLPTECPPGPVHISLYVCACSGGTIAHKEPGKAGGGALCACLQFLWCTEWTLNILHSYFEVILYCVKWKVPSLLEILRNGHSQSPVMTSR